MEFLDFIAAEGPNGRLFAADLRENFWGSAAFGVLVLIFLWKGLPALRKAMKGRTEGIRSKLEEAQTERVAAEKSLNKSSEELPDLGQERSRIRKAATEDAERVKTELIAKAKADAKALVERGHADCEQMKSQAQSDLQAEMGRITRETAEEIVISDIQPQSQSDLIDSYIDKVGQL